MTPSVMLARCQSLTLRTLYVAMFNTGVAGLLAAIGFGDGFAVNFVYSQCIGLIVWLTFEAMRSLLWPDRQASGRLFAPTLLVSILAGWLGGTFLASVILGHPWGVKIHLASLMITAAAGFTAVMYGREREKAARLDAQAALERSRAETVERQVAEARLRLLQAQVEPHFLFNTLANLQALIPVDPARAQKMLANLNDFLRAALLAARKERNTLGEEFDLLRAYLEIVAIRMGDRLKYRIELPESLAEISLPPMLLQPLVENAVKHGLEPKIEGGEVRVQAAAENPHLTLSVADDGLGLGGAPNPGTHTGIAQVRERLHAVYGDAASLDLAEDPRGGVTVTLRLPLQP